MKQATLGRWLRLGLVLAACGVCLAEPPAAGTHDHDHAHRSDSAASGAHHSDDATISHRFVDAEAWAARFEDARRDEWQLPDRVTDALITRDDMVVADIGSATGYFPVRFARAVPRGLVIGADIEPEMVYYLNDRARREKLTNLVSILAAPDDPHLPLPADLIFICNTYHHIDGRRAYFRRLKKQLASQGRVAIVDYRLSSRRGPPHKLAAETVIGEMEAAGYAIAAEHEFLPEQYFLVFRLAD